MHSSHLVLFSALATTMTVACSESAPSDASGTGGSSVGGSSTGIGGTTGSSGGASGVGGNGSGGSGNTTGGAGSGGGSSAFTCPSIEGLTLDLSGKSAGTVATAPNMTVDGGDQNFLEGPVWINGKLYVSQIRTWGTPRPSRVLSLDGTSLTEAIADAGTNGLAIATDGKLLAASHKDNNLVTFDLAAPASAPTKVTDGYMSKGFNSPNDLTVRADGNIYFTDPNYQCGGSDDTCPQGAANQRVYRRSPSGEISIIATSHQQPNGIALSPDGNTLYVAGSGTMEKFTVAADGSVGTASPFASVSGVDGLAIDCAGNVYATVHSQNKIDVFDPSGASLGSISVGTAVTNAAFGGPENKTLYITTYSAELKSVELAIPGYPY